MTAGDLHRVPAALRRRLWYALAVVAGFMELTPIQGALRPGFDQWHQAVSALSLGPGGWIQNINCLLTRDGGRHDLEHGGVRRLEHECDRIRWCF